MVAVTTPSTTHMRKLDRVNATRRGRMMSSKMTPAQANRSHAAPSTPIWSMSVTAIARPTWTHSMEPIAMRAPVRAWFVVTPALNGSETVHVHVIFLDIPFMNHERSFLACDGFVLSSCRRFAAAVIDKSAYTRLPRSRDPELWANRIERGLVRITSATRLEMGYSARSVADLRSEVTSPPLVRRKSPDVMGLLRSI
jgi:hypothetical protein